MSDIYIAGVSMTHFGKHLDRSLKDLTAEALENVLKDAGCDKSQLEAAFFGNCVQGHMEGQDMIRGEVALRTLGVEPSNGSADRVASARPATPGRPSVSSPPNSTVRCRVES